MPGEDLQDALQRARERNLEGLRRFREQQTLQQDTEPLTTTESEWPVLPRESLNTTRRNRSRFTSEEVIRDTSASRRITMEDIGALISSNIDRASTTSNSTADISWVPVSDYSDYFTSTKKKATAKKINEIENDGEIMDIKKLSPFEKKIATCSDLKTYYTSKYIQSIGKFRPINSFITYNRSIKSKDGRKRSLYELAILLGYIYDNRLINIQDLEAIYNKGTVNSNKIEMLCYIADSDVEKIGTISRISYSGYVKADVPDYIKDVLSGFKIKIKSSELSGRVWGLQHTKSKLEGSYFKKYTIDLGKSKSIGTSYYILLDPNDRLGIKEEEKLTESKTLKFTLEDVEFLLPNLKGYNIPKDKTIKIGSNVVVVDKKTSINKDLVFTVQDIKPNTRSKRIKQTSNNRLDIMMCAHPQGNMMRVYAKNLKLIK